MRQRQNVASELPRTFQCGDQTSRPRIPRQGRCLGCISKKSIKPQISRTEIPWPLRRLYKYEYVCGASVQRMSENCCFAPVAFFRFLAFKELRIWEAKIMPRHKDGHTSSAPGSRSFSAILCKASRTRLRRLSSSQNVVWAQGTKEWFVMSCYDSMIMMQTQNKAGGWLHQSHISRMIFRCPCPGVVRGFAPEAAKKHWFLSVQCT